MSVRTTADDKKEEALDYIIKAYKLLMEVIDPETYGSDQFNSKFIQKIEKSIIRLSKIKRDLN